MGIMGGQLCKEFMPAVVATETDIHSGLVYDRYPFCIAIMINQFRCGLVYRLHSDACIAMDN